MVFTGVASSSPVRRWASPRVLVSEFLVVDAERMQDGRLEIPHVNWVFHQGIGKLIRLAMDDAAIDPTTLHPQTKAAVASPRHSAVAATQLVC